MVAVVQYIIFGLSPEKKTFQYLAYLVKYELHRYEDSPGPNMGIFIKSSYVEGILFLIVRFFRCKVFLFFLTRRKKSVKNYRGILDKNYRAGTINRKMSKFFLRRFLCVFVCVYTCRWLGRPLRKL